MTTATDPLPLTRRAKDALWQLPPDEQRQVETALAELAQVPRDQWPTPEMKRLNPQSNFVFYPVGPDIRVLIMLPERNIPPLVTDMMMQELIDFMTKGNRDRA